MAFSFSFSGDDIDASHDTQNETSPALLAPLSTGAFPIPGKPQLPPRRYDLETLLPSLPSKIAYSSMDVTLNDGTSILLPRRELWDVRLQLMAEEDEGDSLGNTDGFGLGSHDVKTGVYEGGFKSWESSVDLVKVLAARGRMSDAACSPLQIIELGCGTALPSISLFKWAISQTPREPCSFVLADYNPTVLQLVTLPNIILAWALSYQSRTAALDEALCLEGELELSPGVISAFQSYLRTSNIKFTFLSGAWSQDFVDLLLSIPTPQPSINTLILGAETIYSPFALNSFTETIFSVLRRRLTNANEAESIALVAAKRLYFGVGGSLDDFIVQAKERGGNIKHLREEADGVRRGVLQCTLDCLDRKLS